MARWFSDIFQDYFVRYLGRYQHQCANDHTFVFMKVLHPYSRVNRDVIQHLYLPSFCFQCFWAKMMLAETMVVLSLGRVISDCFTRGIYILCISLYFNLSGSSKIITANKIKEEDIGYCCCKKVKKLRLIFHLQFLPLSSSWIVCWHF